VITFDPRKDERDFPGGKRKSSERDYRATGRRECLEEVGVTVRFNQIELLSKTVQPAKAKAARPARDAKKHYHLYFCQAFVTDAQVDDGFPVSKEHELVEVVTRAELIHFIRTGAFSATSARLAEQHGLLNE